MRIPDEFESREFELAKVGGESNLADMLTNALQRQLASLGSHAVPADCYLQRGRPMGGGNSH